MTPNEPIDRTHADCLRARDEINAHAHAIRLGIHAWQPKPYEPDPDTTQNGNDQ
jgi:hypothetical protein